jgi:hypothetical protein
VISLPPRRTLRLTETFVVAEVRAAILAVEGVIPYRNNTGALKDENGRLVRYGLADGSSDLIVCAWGRFVAVECKREKPAWLKPGSRAKPSAHEQSQIDFIAQVEQHGGVGGFAWDVPSAMVILERARPSLPQP